MTDLVPAAEHSSATQIQEAPAAMIERVSTVLDAFLGQRPLTLAEVARRSNLPPSSTHRILQRLVELGWIERSRFDYQLGIRMFEFGAQALRQRGLHDIALPVMRRLHRQTGCTVHVSMLVDSEILHLYRVGSGPNAALSWDEGSRQPVEHTAAGHALLATIPVDDWPALSFASAPTCYSIRSRSHLQRELQRVRDRGGVAVDAQGCTLGVTAVAAGIDVEGFGHTALSLSGPADAVRTANLIAAVRNGAAEIRDRSATAPRRSGRPGRSAPRDGAVGLRGVQPPGSCRGIGYQGEGEPA